MKSLWSGQLSVAMLSIPVQLGTSAGNEDLELHMYRTSDGSRIEFRRFAKADGKEVSWGELSKGYETPDGKVALLSNQDFDEAYGEKSREAKILMFTDPGLVSRQASSKTYVIKPPKGSDKAYALLAGALQRSGKVAIVSYALRQRERLAMVYAEEGYLWLEELKWHEDMIKPDFTAPVQAEVSEDEAAMADMLVEKFSGKFDHASYKDESQAKLRDLITRRIESGQTTGIVNAKTENSATQVTDLMAALTASVEEVKAAKTAPKPRARKKVS